MKKLTILCSAFIILLSSCHFTTGSGNIVTEKRSVSNFSGIDASTSIDVEVKIGPAEEIRVEADDNVIKHVVTSVSDGVLKIKIENLHMINDVHVKIYVTTPRLESVKASASASVKVLDVIKGSGKLSFEATSSADIVAEVDAPEIEAEVNSAGSLTLSGKTKNYKAEASSSGDIMSSQLLSENADVDASSSGSIDVYASVSLDAKASSSGDIVYHGAAAVKQSVSSSGSVEKKD